MSDETTLSPIPDSEFRRFENDLLKPPYAIVPNVTPQLRDFGVTVVPDPHAPDVVDAAIAALHDNRPFSVIRLGDGEFNLIGFHRYPGTPTLDRNAALTSFWMYEDRFAADDTWFVALRELLLGAIAQADIVGTLGVDIPSGTQPSAAAFISRQMAKMRAEADRTVWRAGALRGVRVILELARQGALSNKLLTSVHLYFGVLRDLDRLVAAARNVLLITTRAELLPGFRQRYPGRQIELIEVGLTDEATRRTGGSPAFLTRMDDLLQRDFTGTLVLVGAGAWADIYCSWIKQRGGVAIDIGSGFDLLAGDIVRANHRRLPEEVRMAYRIQATI